MSERGDPSLGSAEVEESIRDLGLGRDEKDVRGPISGKTKKTFEGRSRARWRKRLRLGLRRDGERPCRSRPALG